MDGSELRTRILSYNIRVSKEVSNKVRSWDTTNKPTIGVVVMNILSCYRKDIRLLYSRNARHGGKSRYNRKSIDNRNIIKAVDFLEQQGYIHNFKAPRQLIKEKRVPSWISPTQKFIKEFCTNTEIAAKAEAAWMAAHEPIILRDADKNLIDYRDDAMTKEARRVVDGLNRMLADAIIVDHEGEWMDNWYSRIFNEDFFSGGRFFQAGILSIENKRSKNRLRILINTESVVEVDYANLHIRILYAQKGLSDVLQPDAYLMPLDPSQWCQENRDLIKYSTNIMLNCRTKQQAIGAIQSHINSVPAGTYCFTSGRQVVEAIMKGFPDIAESFCSSECSGLKLQNTDSWIAHYVISDFLLMNQIILPVHDSFIVQRKNLEMLIDSMDAAYKRVVGTDSKTHMKMNIIEQNLLVVRDVSR